MPYDYAAQQYLLTLVASRAVESGGTGSEMSTENKGKLVVRLETPSNGVYFKNLTRRYEISSDLASTPDPPLTYAEMHRIEFAAHAELLKCLRARRRAMKKSKRRGVGR